ncbi:MarR family winged helix-turn-helix transcriptional regulator [Litorivivens sp.]|uniref:MarR family winged helix-turn-helix transcriptional regulator n=1 Tax=Litorivivens sp. TaxID=2020868 RepID=UPI0035699FD3
MSYLNLDVQICHSLYSATNALIRAYRPLLEPLGLTYPQYIVMLSLWEKDGVSVKTLSEHTRLDAGTLTPILKRLEDKGLLRRTVFAGDERQKRLEVTEAGQQLKTRAEKIPEAMACMAMTDREQAAQLKQLCEQLYQTLSG